MACRIGITTDLDRRRRYWENEYPNTFSNWEVLEKNLSKEEAQAKENEYAASRGCESHPGGDDAESTIWHVYYFEHNNH